MAEAAVESPAARFFCHKCTQEICPVLPDYICPRCQSGFIEELTQGPQENISEESDEEVDPLAQVAELWNMLHFLRRVDPEHQNSGGTTENQPSGNEGLNSSRPGPSRRQHRFGRGASRRQGQEFDSFRQPRTEGFLQQLVASLSENTGLVANASFPVFLNLHSNPGDYAWGRGGWNAIITQLMNQLDGTGPPPLPKEKIEEIPVVNISQEQVDKILQCTVCMEDFRLGEPVKKLSCQHHFHNDCIIPWLELHGTCPICRKLLNDESSQDSPIGSTLTNTSSSSTQPGPSNTRSQNRRSSNSSTTATGTSYSPHLPSVYDFTDEFD